MKRVLITGGRAPVALELARQFEGAGWGVFVADSSRFPLAAACRGAIRRCRVPPPRFEPAKFAAEIRQIAIRERIDLIVPTCEEVFYLARFSRELRAVTELFCSDFAVLEQLHNKWTFGQLARSLGLNAPEAWLLTSRRDIGRLPAPASEWVFKPAFSRFAVHTLIRPEPDQLAGIEPTHAFPWVAQRHVAGRELCSYSVARRGEIRAHVLYEPIWRVGRGSGICFRPVLLPAAETFAARVAAAIGYTGQIGFDFIENASGLWVLECNPRATSGLHLFAAGSGLDRAFASEAAPPIHPQEGADAMLASAMLVVGLPQAFFRGTAARFARDFFWARDVIWSWRDPVPAIYLYLGLGEFMLRAMRERITARAASTRDLEWDGEAIA